MGFLATALSIILAAAAGFILGALVYRNNSKQLNNLIITLKDLEAQVKKIKK